MSSTASQQKTRQCRTTQTSLWLSLLLLIALSLSGAFLAKSADSGFGRVSVTTVEFMTESNTPMVAKIYRPTWVSTENPAPGLLALHGYQSDKEATTTFGTIELARRGFVVVSIDQFGHGYSTQHGVDPDIMSGAAYGLDYLKSLPFVDSTRLGTFGHSTGSIYAVKLAKSDDAVRAVVALSGNGGDPDIHEVSNYLLVQGDNEEIGPYREKTFPVSSLTTNPARLEAFGLHPDDALEWNHTYGDFSDGSARRAELVSGTHLGVMTSGASNTAVVDWFNTALRDGEQDSHWIPSQSHVYQWKEIGGSIALFSLVASLIPLLGLLLRFRAFAGVQGSEGSFTGGGRMGLVLSAAASIAMTIVLYPLCTQKGGGDDPISATIPFLPLQMGNGIAIWLVVTTVLTLVVFLIWKRIGGGRGESWSDLGVVPPQDAGRRILTAFGLSAALIAWPVLIVTVTAFFRGPEFRVLWPMLKTLTPERARVLLPYFLIIWAFFFVVNGLSLNTMSRIAARDDERPVVLWAKRFTFSWISAVFGLCLLWLFHFVPGYMGIGPGMDVIGLPAFGGRWMMMLAVIIPQFTALVALNVWLHVRIRSIWVASTVGAALFTWMMVGGQVGAF
ncbi:alpha/beta hydrolase [Actinomyces mediterranea]|uniref:alpha/beta hydrolase n=1 Tax=Actinomyces mediterranea TaxID=1871028 RepID=UPI00097080F8|nr:CocE/NonD family hydrolase [Actinomyces mediterranea]